MIGFGDGVVFYDYEFRILREYVLTIFYLYQKYLSMINETLDLYQFYFKRLNRSSHKILGKAPHKPILLLSILQLVRDHKIISNRIFITTDLVIAFKSNWNVLVASKHLCNFTLPFFHLKSEPFWRLSFTHPKASSLKSISTINVLKDFVAFAELDEALFQLMLDVPINYYLESFLLDFYFPETKALYKASKGDVYDLEAVIKNEIVNETGAVYSQKINEMQEVMTEVELEEDRFIRGGIFKREVPRLYNHTCCISGMKIETSIQAQMVDACHIKPFSVSNDDTITNGICLSPNLHRAFDRGLLTINPDYLVRISPAVREEASVYALKQFEGKPITLPLQQKHYPSVLNFEWHRKERFVF